MLPAEQCADMVGKWGSSSVDVLNGCQIMADEIMRVATMANSQTEVRMVNFVSYLALSN
jgi:hypothetical protein